MNKSTEDLILEKLNKIESVQTAQTAMMTDTQKQQVVIAGILESMLNELKEEGQTGEMATALGTVFESLEVLTDKFEKMAKGS